MRVARIRQFTFLELGIAISIMLAVSLALYTYSRGVSRSWEKIIKEKNRFQELLNHHRAIDKALSNAVPFTWTSDDAPGDSGKFPFILAEWNRLRVAYLHELHDATEGAIRFAEFLVQDGNLYLTYSDRPFYQWSDLGGLDQTVLLAEASGKSGSHISTGRRTKIPTGRTGPSGWTTGRRRSPRGWTRRSP